MLFKTYSTVLIAFIYYKVVIFGKLYKVDSIIRNYVGSKNI